VNNRTRLTLAGLALGVLGLVIQWIADPPKFNPFPPGIVFIVVCGALTAVLARRWWAPVFAVFISLWIVFGGLAAGVLTPNFSKDLGTAGGTAVMTLGLLFAAVMGILAMVFARRTRVRA
jgi:drug/metabolite transporter (DMT)-like permease